MTGNVINFKAVKKGAGYDKKEIEAAENRKKFGQNKSDTCLDAFEKSGQSKHLDGHKSDND